MDSKNLLLFFILPLLYIQFQFTCVSLNISKLLQVTCVSAFQPRSNFKPHVIIYNISQVSQGDDLYIKYANHRFSGYPFFYIEPAQHNLHADCFLNSDLFTCRFHQLVASFVAYLAPCQTFMMDYFAKIVYDFQILTL